MRDLHNEFVYRKITEPNKILAGVLRLGLRILCKQRNVQFIYDEDYLQMEQQQMVILCQHRSRCDYIYLYAGLKRSNYHILCGYQNVFQPVLFHLLKRLGVIAKMLYQPDAHATMQLLRAVKMGNSIVVFPEGIQSTSGSTHPINPATMKLLAKLKLPVALVTLKGAYFTRTRYSTDIKKGKITAHFSKLFDPADFTQYTTEQLYQRLMERFQYNEFSEHRGEKIAFRGKKPNIYGLDNIVYKCPQCLSEYQFAVENDTMRCAHCGFAVSMDDYYDIAAVEGTLPFENTDVWYKWQRSVLSEEVKDDNFVMSTKVKIGRINTQKLSKNSSVLYYGEGTLTLTNKGLTYTGTRDGEQVEIFFRALQVFSLSISLDYNLDLYYDGEYFNFKLLENEKQVTKWMLAAEEIHNLYDRTWCSASNEVYYAK
ncbi:MAG: 1-acyl-sn-glycerol-3-phosphate acyltransferase [Oscillospiraceae bacterium]|nr:1-acyl-sn-glycerol-3-phosphate acyltransferase [Oscillospiraceae bacterium]